MSNALAAEDSGQFALWRAVILSLVLHALVVVFYPRLSRVQLPSIPERLEIELFSTKTRPAVAQMAEAKPEPPAPEPPVSQPPPVSKPEAKPIEAKKEVLASKEPAAPQDYKVPDTVTPAAETPVSKAPPAEAAPAVNTASEHAAKESKATEARESSAASSAPSAKAAEDETVAASDDEAWDGYGKELHALVSKSKRYPAIAIRRHMEGDVKIEAKFIKGELVDVSLVDGSGHTPLDEEAIRMVKKAIAQLGIKGSLAKKSFRVTIPVVFRLD